MNNNSHALSFQIESMILDNALQKYAGVVKYSFGQDSPLSASSVLSGLGSWVSEFVSSHIDTSSPFKFIESIGDILIPGMLWSSHPVFAALLSVAEELGYPIHDVLEKIYEYIKNAFKNGKTPSIDSALSLIPKIASGENLFELIRQSCLDHSFVKTSTSNILVKYAGMFEWLGSFFKKILQIDSKGSKSTPFSFSKLLGWLVKGILIAMATSWATKKGKGMLGLDGKKDAPASAASALPTGSDRSAPTVLPTAATAASTKLRATGWGQNLHNQGDKSWVIQIPPGQNVEQMVLSWIHNIYDNQLQDKEDDIVDSASFNSVVTSLQSDDRSEKNWLYIPTAFKSVKQIVDTALSDIVK